MELKKMYIFITIFIFVNVYSQVYLPNGRVNSSSNGNMGIKTSVLTADFVFEDNYHLPKLEDIEKHIKEKKTFTRNSFGISNGTRRFKYW